jgi:hypothetical protein
VGAALKRRHAAATILSVWVNAMHKTRVTITAPILSRDAVVRFSAYGFGWGYRAFALPYEAVCKQLGARDESEQQITLAFELGRLRILRGIEKFATLSYEGQRFTLSADEL